MDTINLNLKLIKDLGLTINEYLTLFQIYLKKSNIKIDYNYNVIDIVSLSEKGYISVRLEEYIDGKYSIESVPRLTSKGIEVFLSENDLFNEFIKTYPTSVKTGPNKRRVLSPDKPDGVIGSKLRKKWMAITKGDIIYQELIIKCLKKEIDIRTKNRDITYMQNIETWLNNGTWEKYESFLNSEDNEDIKETRLNR